MAKTDISNLIKEKVDALLERLGMTFKTVVTEEDNDGMKLLRVNIDAEDSGRLIGYRGQNLSAIQYIITMIVRPDLPEDHKILLDVNNYRVENIEKLKERAKAAADLVIQTGEEYNMGFMNPFDRRIVHMAVAEIEGVETESIGEEKMKRLIVKKKVSE